MAKSMKSKAKAGKMTARSAGSGSPGRLRNILLFGYWPPTDTGNILSNYATPRTVSGQSGGAYSVQAFSPVFTNPIGWTSTANPPASRIPFWGSGTGRLQVDYRKTAEFFWRTVNRHKPIAIMSFSRSLWDANWWLEPYVYNYANARWRLTIEYHPLVPWPPASSPSSPFTLAPPWVGGGADDPSPFGPGGPHPTPPRTGHPPDPTLAAVTVYDPAAGVLPPPSRFSTLPLQKIITAIATLSIPTSALNPLINGSPHAPVIPPPADPRVKTAILGNYVSAFMAYHGCWYQACSRTLHPADPCLMAGHTHVGGLVGRVNGMRAVDAQLTALLALL